MNSNGRKRILLVEDDRVTALIEEKILKREGYEVTNVSTGEKAVEAVRVDPSIDIVLMDINLGEGIDGTEAAKQILEIRSLPVVFLTSHSEREMVEKVRGITRYGYVLKNSGDFVLLSSIEMAFELFEAHGTVERKHEELRVANQKLGEKEEKYRNLVEKISDLIYEVNAQGAFTYLSPKAKDILGYEPAELTGRNFIELVHDDDKSRLAGRFSELSRGVEYALEYRLLNSRGDILWVRTKSSPIWENERFSGARGLLIDITESKLMEEKLRESGEELWWLFKSMLNAFVMFQSVFDDDGTFISYRFVYINDAYERITGVRNDEIRGRTVHEVWPGTEPEWIRRYGEVAVTGVSQTFDMYHDPTGKIYHCNVYRPGDTRDRFCVIFEDITERRRVQEALERQRNFAESIVETAQTIILVLDPRGRIIRFNAFFEEISGYRLEEVRGRDWFDTFLPGRSRAVTMDLFAEAINNIQTRGNIDSIVTRDGRERQIEWYDKALRDADDTLIGLLCVGLDVTERMLMEKEMQWKTALLEAQTNATLEGILIVDGKGNKIFQNQRCVDMWKIPSHIVEDNDDTRQLEFVKNREKNPEEFVNKVLYLYTHPDETSHDELEFNDGTFLERYSAPVTGKDGMHFGRVWTFHDITGRRRAEEKVKSLLAEKELLLREVHHRTKNNMGIIMSLLSLQSGVLKDPSAALSLDAARSRVKSMMVLYEKLYQSSDFRTISTKVYLGALIDEIAGTVSGRESVAIEKHIDDVILDSDILSPLGIILNELLTNAVKHAFDGRDKGVIGVSLSVKGSNVALTVEDNGTGVPESIDLIDSTGFGLQLVRILTEQLGGAIRLERSNGSRFIVEFELQ